MADVASLLTAYENDQHLLERPAFHLTASEMTARVLDAEWWGPSDNARVSGYALVREIGRGGMGAVYEALCDDGDSHERFAVKLVKREMATDFIIHRFKHERRILAKLEHRYIARLLDGGTTADGLPYLVMEYVEGQPIDQYAADAGLSTMGRLDVFLNVCEAVSHAHQQGVIHRDLKPSNILVTHEGTPKLLDFGIAKLVNPDLEGKSGDHTATAFRVMTPRYASPEQLSGRAPTEASDVYSLGVLLYVLLTGEHPYRFSDQAPDVILRSIEAQPARKPSEVITNTDEVKRELKGNLDRIVLKALRIEPARRYESVEQLANDIRLHLAGRKITAKDDSIAYRSKRFVRQHRAYVLPTVIIGVLSLFLGLLLLYILLRSQKASEAEAPAQSMKISRVTQTGHVNAAALSPDGQNIAYAENEGEMSSLWLQRAGTNNPLQLLPPAKTYYEFVSFSRDGNTLYYSRCQPGCQLYKMPVSGGVETALGIRADSRVTFSPDGKRMAYVRSDVESSGLVTARLFVANADGTGEEFLNWEGGSSVYQRGAPAWSPDGKVIAFSIIATEDRRRMKVMGVRVADRNVSTLISPSWLNISDVAWVPDGSALVINGRDATSEGESRLQVWRVPLAGGEARRITNDLNNYFSLSLSADGSTLIALQWQSTSGLWIAPAENPSAAAQVTAGTLDRQDGRYGVSAAPDGRLIYVSDHSGKKDLWSINADGTGLRQLTDATHKDLSPVVSPDGRYIVFQSCRNANSDRAYNLWRVDADGRNPMHLTYGTYDSEPVFSPDGESVVYVEKEDHLPKLRRVPIGGGDSIPLTNEFSQHPAFSPDGKVLVYYRMDQKQRDQRHFVFIPAEGGAPFKTIPAPRNFGAIMHWAPTGDALFYRDTTITSIWLQPLDGTPPSLVLKLRNQTLSTFRFSPDGRRLAYSSGPQLRDVVMITRFN
jgi:serine/threonine protein kinase/Tol biopolymer transport system component